MLNVNEKSAESGTNAGRLPSQRTERTLSSGRSTSVRGGSSNVRQSGITVADRGSALGQLVALGMLLVMLGAFVFTQLPGVSASRLRELQVPSHPGRAPDGLLLASPSQTLHSVVVALGVDE